MRNQTMNYRLQLKGTSVLGSDDQKIGDVTDILFDKMGHVKAYFISVGGILGIGAKEVALEQSAFQEMPGTKGRPEDKQFIVYQLKVSMTKSRGGAPAFFLRTRSHGHVGRKSE